MSALALKQRTTEAELKAARRESMTALETANEVAEVKLAAARASRDQAEHQAEEAKARLARHRLDALQRTGPSGKSGRRSGPSPARTHGGGADRGMRREHMTTRYLWMPAVVAAGPVGQRGAPAARAPARR